jgi:hypothetical protein
VQVPAAGADWVVAGDEAVGDEGDGAEPADVAGVQLAARRRGASAMIAVSPGRAALRPVGHGEVGIR